MEVSLSKLFLVQYRMGARIIHLQSPLIPCGVSPPGLRNEMSAYQTDCGPIRGSFGSRESSFMRLEHEPYSGVGMTCKGRGPRRNGRNQEKHLKPLALNYWVGP